jgi:hypothetical protein
MRGMNVTSRIPSSPLDSRSPGSSRGGCHDVRDAITRTAHHPRRETDSPTVVLEPRLIAYWAATVVTALAFLGEIAASVNLKLMSLRHGIHVAHPLPWKHCRNTPLTFTTK